MPRGKAAARPPISRCSLPHLLPRSGAVAIPMDYRTRIGPSDRPEAAHRIADRNAAGERHIRWQAEDLLILSRMEQVRCRQHGPEAERACSEEKILRSWVRGRVDSRRPGVA